MPAQAAAPMTPAQPGASPFPNQQVAPLTQQQIDAMNAVNQQAPGAQNFLNTAQQQQLDTLSGNYLNPQSNQFLQQYYNAAAQPMVQQYQQAIAPNILQQAAQTGTIGSQGMDQAFANAEQGLGQGLGNLSANIFEPAYQQERQIQQNAAAGAGNTASSQFVPSQYLQQSGQIGQNQAQNVLQTGYQNAYNQASWPFQALDMLGNAFGKLGGGNSVSFGSGSMGGGGGMK